jgi:hypothetical protein
MPKMDAAGLSEMIPLCWTVIYLKICVFYGARISLSCSQELITSPALSQMNPLHCTSLRYILIVLLSSDVYLGLQAGLFSHSEKGNFVLQ